MKRVLIIGPLPDFKNHLQFGGATVLMNNIINYWKDNGLPFSFIQTNKYSNLKTKDKARRRSFFWFMFCFFSRVWKYDIIWFNISDNVLISQYPLFLKFLKFFRKKVLLHKFGGSLSEVIQSINIKKRNTLIRALKKTDLLMFDTIGSLKDLEKLTGCADNIIWYPNGRKKTTVIKNNSEVNHRLVFIGHISDEKGIREVIEVMKFLPSKYTLDLYGAIKDRKYKDFEWSNHGANYHGEVNSNEVSEILSRSDLLLLPSWKEGYPGAVIEALSVGIPVIVSNKGGLPEMINDGVEGKIIPCKDVQALKDAIISITEEKYRIMSKNAYNRFLKNFDSDANNKRVYEKINSL